MKKEDIIRELNEIVEKSTYTSSDQREAVCEAVEIIEGTSEEEIAERINDSNYLIKRFCCELENTKDGSLNFGPENILNRQLVFTGQLTNYQRKNYRWIEYEVGIGLSEEELVRRFMDKFGNANPKKPIIKIEWEMIKDGDGHRWGAWVIKE